MAKARNIPIDPEEAYAQTAARVVRVRADELFSDRDDVLDVSDIERVHAMRVATRRLRAVLEIFAPCFPRDEHRAVLREVKQLADALGARRDPDVQLEALGERPGVAAFVERLRAEQRAGNETLEAALRRTDALRGRLDRLVAA